MIQTVKFSEQTEELSKVFIERYDSGYEDGFSDGVLSDRASNYWKGVGYAQAREDLYADYYSDWEDAQNLKAIRDYMSNDFGFSEYDAARDSARALFPEMAPEEVTDFLRGLVN
ncbi:hypothetical protein SDC9_203203 [bioreactor metagenome]|uniref:Uncharacterized protein n=1 Tax=bioreactor metagenome TaxID=1076179 RepID=A0A645IYJ4_9ZZZZ